MPIRYEVHINCGASENSWIRWSFIDHKEDFEGYAYQLAKDFEQDIKARLVEVEVPDQPDKYGEIHDTHSMDTDDDFCHLCDVGFHWTPEHAEVCTGVVVQRKDLDRLWEKPRHEIKEWVDKVLEG